MCRGRVDPLFKYHPIYFHNLFFIHYLFFTIRDIVFSVTIRARPSAGGRREKNSNGNQRPRRRPGHHLDSKPELTSALTLPPDKSAKNSVHALFGFSMLKLLNNGFRLSVFICFICG